MPVTLIVYTTKYRKGGALFPIVANTLATEKRESGCSDEIIVRAVESKREVLRIFTELIERGEQIVDLSFVGHSGMYGPMFGTIAFPEQFSPHEWRTMKIPFAPGATANFYCCRSARWFAPFFARTFGVATRGFFWYTTFSKSKTKYRRAGTADSSVRLYTIGCKGRKSHGIGASFLKFAGLMPAEEMKSFVAEQPEGDASYDRVAEAYDQAFADITVRRPEWKWLSEKMSAVSGASLLDIGCGNGALLNVLSPRLGKGIGVDKSGAILERARIRNKEKSNLEFVGIESPELPFENGTFDFAVSMMSFRYLDWDPLLREIKRVVKPGGTLLVVDMVTVPVKPREYPRFLSDKAKTFLHKNRSRSFKQNLDRLVNHPDWKVMLKYNPIRSEHEMKWYLESRFPGRKIETLNLAWNSRIVAFDSGPVERLVDAEMSYP